MKIGYDAKRALNNNSGLGNYSRYIIHSADKFSEHKLYLFTPKAEQRHLDDLIHLSSVELVTPKSKNKLLGSYWRSFGQVKDINKLELDVFHGLSNELPLSIKKSRVAKVVTIHDLIFLRFPKLYKPLDRKIYNKKFRQACEDADKIIAISEQTKNDILHYYQVDEKKIEVIYQDCDEQFQTQPSREKLLEVKKRYYLPKQFLLSVGTIEERKNQLLILKALKEISDIPLVLVGRSTPYQDKLQEFINENGLQKRVTFINNVQFSDLPAIYSLAEVFVYPSIFEGFGIPIIEAQNLSTPVVTSTGSCFAETGGDAALYSNPQKPEELAKNINKLLLNEKVKTDLIINGLDNVKRFRAERTFSQLNKVYSELIIDANN
jgi:glycosyltransferase involved in cell wall biosynthesis